MAAFRAGKIEPILCNDSLADWEKGIITPPSGSLFPTKKGQKKDCSKVIQRKEKLFFQSMIILKSWIHKLITSFSYGNIRRNQYWLLKSLDSFRCLWIAVFKMLPDTHESNFVRQILQNLLLNLLSVNKCWQSFTVSASVFFKNLLKMLRIDTKWRFKIVAMHSLLSGFPRSRTVGQNLKRCIDFAILCLKRRF